MRSWMVPLMLVVPAGLIVAALLLVVNNPTIDHTNEGTYTCLAPYDHVLLGSTNDRGDWDDLADITTRCDRADRNRFTIAAILFGVGVIDGLVGIGLVRRHRRRASEAAIAAGA